MDVYFLVQDSVHQGAMDEMIVMIVVCQSAPGLFEFTMLAHNVVEAQPIKTLTLQCGIYLSTANASSSPT